ncbi:MAG: putative Ig domain-containing protein [Acidimicrobiales bacterium]
MEQSSWESASPSLWTRFRWWIVSGAAAVVAVVLVVVLVATSGGSSKSTSNKSVASPVGEFAASGGGAQTTSGGSGSSTTGDGSSTPATSSTSTGGQTTSAQVGSDPPGVSSAGVGSAISVQTTSLPAAEAGQPYTAALQAAGASGGVSWSLGGGSLPAGLTLSPSGVISGKPSPSATGSYAPLVVATDSQGDTTEAAVTLDVVGGPVLYAPNDGLANPPGFAPKASVPTSVDAGSFFQATWVVSSFSGVPDYSWSIASGSLPPGVPNPSCSDAPQCLDAYTSGTPTTPGVYTFDVRVKDAQGVTGNQTDTVTVNPAPILTTASLPAANADDSYSAPVEVAGGTGPYNWSISGAGLENLSISGTSALARITTGGNALALGPGSYPITVSVQDADGLTATANLVLSVGSLPQLVITPTSLPGADEGVSYHSSLVASGGSGSGYTWSATGLPLGVGLSPTGSFAGSPTETGTYPVNITVTDGAGNTVTTAETLVVSSPPTIEAISEQTGQQTVPFGPVAVTATGGTPNALGEYIWSATGLPPGLSISPVTGAISGTPQSSGFSTAVVTVTDSAGGTASTTVPFSIAGAPAPTTTTAT